MSKKPNLLVILSDQHQHNSMSCAGHPVAQTPNLDALAARGTRFTNAYTPSPICVPARAAFASGQYVHQNRLWDNAMPYIGDPKGWGHALQAQGTPVQSIGKLHYRSAEDDTGFDEQHIPMQVYEGVGMVWASARKEDERVTFKDVRMMGDYIGPGESSYTKYDAAVTDRTKSWLQEAAKSDDDRPWCLYVGLVAPHHPLVAPQDFFDKYPLDTLPPTKLHPRDGYQQHPWIEKMADAMVGEDGWKDEEERLTAIAAYFGLVSWMDHNVGQIVETLMETGLLDDTTIIYSSDHGENLGARGLWGKMNMYQESAAIPMIVAPAPNSKLNLPKTCDTAVSLLDVSETIIDHFGADLTGVRPGKSLYDIASEPVDDTRVVFSEYHAVGAVTGEFMLRKGPWKYIHYVGYDPELFNLVEDPEELENLAPDLSYAETLRDLHAALCEICDPEEVNDMAFEDQNALIESVGGYDVAITLGAPSATPPPKT